MTYYSARGEPTGMWDGVERREGAMGSDVDATYKYYFGGYVGRASVPSPCVMDISASINEDQYSGSVVVGITPESAMSGNYELVIAVYQKLYEDSDPDIPHLGLKRIHKGDISFNGTDRVEVTADYMADIWWDMSRLGVVAFVRDLSTKEIQQGVATETFEAPPVPTRRHERPFSR
ncbi:MAG TPA: hypothetical protein PK014_12430 [Thermoanaerobaculia bacterium]|nr:hypothetical protein [Thermoanaerobaculia bacterium]HUM30861.1 hypothetical protein [Thermoanaerobaculia bacterium]HXK69238.1 hypothetical protein [Thermoanaerobaculia bacterium]